MATQPKTFTTEKRPPFHTSECSPWGEPCKRHLGLHHYQCEICRVDCTMGTPAGPPRTATDKVTRCRECDQALPRYMAEGKEAVIARAASDMLSALRDLRKWKAAEIALDKEYRNQDTLIVPEECKAEFTNKLGTILLEQVLAEERAEAAITKAEQSQ
jgi:hypothetical protein